MWNVQQQTSCQPTLSLSNKFPDCHIAPYVNHHLLNTMNSICEIKKKLSSRNYWEHDIEFVESSQYQIPCEPKTPLIYENQESERMSHSSICQHDSYFIRHARLCRLITLFSLEPGSATNSM